MAFAVAAGALSVYYIFNKPHRGVSASKPDFIIAAAELHDEYESDETKADKKYLGKIIQVYGAIADIKKNQDKAFTIIIKAESEFTGVCCDMEKSFDNIESALKSGDNITIKGQCSGFLMDVALTKCILVE